MSDRWDALTAAELRAVAAALASGRIGARPSELALQSLCARENAAWLAATLAAIGGEAAALAGLLDALALEREQLAKAQRATELVWTGPEIPNDTARDTGAVVRELFVSARRRILIVGYAIHGGRDLFKLLADRFDRATNLEIEMVVDVRRESGDTSLASEIVARFARDFFLNQWPGKRLPAVFYDPNSLAEDSSQRSAMHAKCIVVDDAAAFVTSANFTSAAQGKNIEVGVLVRNPSLIVALAARFRFLAESCRLLRLASGGIA